MTQRPFIQKLFGIIAGVLSSIFFLVLSGLPRIYDDRTEAVKLRIGVLVVVLLWAAVLFGIKIVISRIGNLSHNTLIHIASTWVSFIALQLVIEVPFLVLFLAIMVGFFTTLLFGWSDSEGSVMHVQKIIRRLVGGLWVFDAYALMTVLYALHSFFQSQVPYLLLVFLGAIMYGGIALMMWRLYFSKEQYQKMFFYAGVLAVVMFEMIWVMKYLPVGYLVQGAMVTWVWYVLQLFSRFNFTNKGIIWKEQVVFLIGNAVLYTAVLVFLVRWI